MMSSHSIYNYVININVLAGKAKKMNTKIGVRIIYADFSNVIQVMLYGKHLIGKNKSIY